MTSSDTMTTTLQDRDREGTLRTRSRLRTRLNVLLAGDSLDVGGAERHLVDLAVALHRKGHHVTVACTREGALQSTLDDCDIPVEVLTRRLVKRRFSAQLTLQLWKSIRARDFDLIHSHMYACSLSSAIAGIGAPVPLVVTEHSEAGWRRFHARLLSRWYYQNAAAIIAVSEPICRRLTENEGVRKDRVHLITSAVTETPSLSQLPCRRQSNRLAVGVVARLYPEKGVSFFVEAAGRLAPAFPHCDFIVVGDGPQRESLLCRAREIGLEHGVHFLGFRTDARALIEMLDLLVVPSVSEGAPLVVLEAMAAGVPIVATSVGGIPDQIRHGQEGLLVPPADPGALGEACAALLRDRATARRLGQAGRQRVRQRFNHAAMVQQIEAIYHSVVARAVVPAVAPINTGFTASALQPGRDHDQHVSSADRDRQRAPEWHQLDSEERQRTEPDAGW